VAVAAEYGDLNEGDFAQSSGPSDAFADGFLSALYNVADITAGYHTEIAGAPTRLALGVRFADWRNRVTTTNPGEFVRHNWKGAGPRAEIQSNVPLSGPFSVQLGAGASYMWGKVKTSAPPAWFCDDCTDYSANSWNADASAGLGWKFSPSSTLVV